jgi:hypothetical protein
MVIKTAVAKKKPSDTYAIIAKGGEVASDKRKEAKKFVVFPLRIPVKLMNEIDEVLEKTTYGMSKTGWISQVIHEKIKQIKQDY